MSPVRWAALALAAALLGGCRYAYEEHGDPRFLEDQPELVRGETTPAEAAERLGPPSAVWTEGGRLFFLWRYEEVRDRSVTLRYFGGRWVQGRYGTRLDSTLVAVFDPNDRLELASRSIETR